jgi:multicomponent Na+:H+ antiporter subunit B
MRMKWIAHLFLLTAVGILLLYGGLSLPPRGDVNSPASRHVSPRYIEHGLEETGTPNIVTAVLADYRSFDTLGETLVIFTAGLACFFAMIKRKDED